jgi:putative chitinase
MELTLEQLKQLLPRNPNVEDWYESLTKILPDYGIDTPLRIAAFISQCAHESAGFTILKENLNYRAITLRQKFSKYFPNDEIAQRYASLPNKQEAIANRIYANRMGNGPEESGDGWRYCGRGLIQLTGKNNYSLFADSIGMTVEEASDYLRTFEGAAQSACWYWETNNLNRFADTGDVKGLTKAINGGYNGLQERIDNYEHALSVLGEHQ